MSHSSATLDDSDSPGALQLAPQAPARFDRLCPLEVRTEDARWTVAHTLPRQEKALAETLLTLGIPCYLPLVPRVRYYGHRRRVVEMPLFPSYVFMLVRAEQRWEALRSKRIAQVLLVHDQSNLENELRQLDHAVRGEALLDPYPFLSEGTPVVVARGPMRGLEGLVELRRSPNRLVLNVSMLGQATSLEIDASLLEPIGLSV